MTQTAISATSGDAIEALLRSELAKSDVAMSNAGPIMRHLLRNDDQSVFSDEIIARVRGMLVDIARQLIVALAEAAGHPEPRKWAHEAADELAGAFMEDPVFVAHGHALAIEWQLTERLQSRLALDPVLTPLVQTLISSTDPATATVAMNLLAAQARFGQSQRRMELPLGELPGDLFHLALTKMHAQVGLDPASAAPVAKAEKALRLAYDEQRNRLGLLDRLVAAMGSAAPSALAVDHAGVALFLTALSIGSGQDREVVTMATTESQLPRLTLMLAASGLKPDTVAAQFLALHPDIILPEGFETLTPDRAAVLLARATEVRGRGAGPLP